MKVIVPILLTIVLLVGCANGIDRDTFVKDSSDIYVQMFSDGEQSTEVNEMFEEYEKKYPKLKGEELELYEAIDGMYRGLANGEATKYQLEAMRLLNEIRGVN